MMIDDIRPTTRRDFTDNRRQAARGQRPTVPSQRTVEVLNNNQTVSPASQNTQTQTPAASVKTRRKLILQSAFLSALLLRIKAAAKLAYLQTNRFLEKTGHKLGDRAIKVLSRHHRTRRGVYRYGIAEFKRESVLGVKASFLVLLAVILLPLAQFSPVLAATDTQTLVPNGDNANGTNNWATNSGASDSSCAGGVDCDYVDEEGETDYLGTGTGMNTTTAEQEFDMTDLTRLGSFNHVSQVVVTINAGISCSCLGNSTTCDSLSVRLFIDGAYPGTTNTVTLATSAADHTFAWSGLSEPAHADIRVEIIRNPVGGRNANNIDDNVRMYWVKADVTYDYTVTSDVQQAHFRWRDDTTALDTDGGWLAAEDSNSMGSISQLQ